jgi:hypothetical protein
LQYVNTKTQTTPYGKHATESLPKGYEEHKEKQEVNLENLLIFNDIENNGINDGENKLSMHYLQRRMDTLNRENNEFDQVIRSFRDSDAHHTITKIQV